MSTMTNRDGHITSRVKVATNTIDTSSSLELLSTLSKIAQPPIPPMSIMMSFSTLSTKMKHIHKLEVEMNITMSGSPLATVSTTSTTMRIINLGE